MDGTSNGMLKNILGALIPLSVFLITLILGLLLRKFIFSRFSRWADKTKSNIDDIIAASLKGPFMIWCLMFGAYFAIDVSSLPEGFVAVSGRILLVLGIISVTMAAANITSKSIRIYSGSIDTALPVTSLTQNISRIIIFGVGVMIILNSLGISITPILATLGVGGLAVALALQDTLSNLFSGFHIIVSKQLRVGDYIKLESGEEGYVTDITWRTTKIRMLPNNIVLVPNDKLIKAVITNYCLPEKEMAVLVNLGVHYNSDLKKVEKITCEVAKEILTQIKGGVKEFQPFIRYHTFADFSINFTVILRANEFVDQYILKHEFIKKLHERYAREGIVIPYPIRAMNYDQEKAV